MSLLEPSPVVALARKVYATVRLRSRDYGVDSLCRARQPPTPFFREGSDGKTKHSHSTCLTRLNLGLICNLSTQLSVTSEAEWRDTRQLN